MSSLAAVLALLAAYLLGSVSFAYLLVRTLKGVDLRSAGSGNLGATNAGRVLGRGLGLLILVLDLGKGLLPVLVARGPLDDPLVFGGSLPLSVGMGAAAFLGHCYPCWLRFRGGKGVATAAGAILGLAPLAALIALGGFVLGVLVTRMVSVGSMAAAVVLPIGWLCLRREEVFQHPSDGWIMVFFVALTLFVLLRHTPNLHRIIEGTEPRIGRKRT
jgi:glycerol-3-phosphate acyltransferase PlsY